MPLVPALLLPRSSAVSEHVHVLPIHRRVQLTMEAGLAAVGVMLLAITSVARSLPTYTACTSVLTALLCGGCFAHLLLRERRGLPESPRKSAMLATLIVCVFLAGLSDAGLAKDQGVDSLSMAMSALRHEVLPLGIFTYWLVFCGPVMLVWRTVLPFGPMLGWLGFAVMQSTQARQLRFPWRAPGWPTWSDAAMLAGLMVVLFAVGLLVLKVVKACLVDAGRRSRAFGDWDEAKASRSLR